MKQLILFYDGPCILCNFWIQKLCRWDKNDRLQFSSLDSAFAKYFFKKHPSHLLAIDSILAWDPEEAYEIEAQAVFRILKYLGGLWKFFLIFQLVPTSWANRLYRFVAARRYRWFGKYDICPLPEKRYTHKFL